MPVSLLTSKALDPKSCFSARAMLSGTVGRDRARPDWIVPSFSLEEAWESICENRLAEDLANSFLIIAGKTERSVAAVRESEDLAWHYSVERHPAFATAKRFFIKDGEISTARRHITQVTPPEVPVSHSIDDSLYLHGKLWWLRLTSVLNTPGWSAKDICEWARPWIDALCREAGLGYAVSLSLDKAVPGALFDWTPMNCIETAEGQLAFFDKEWQVESELTLSFVILRGLFGSLASVSSCASPAQGTPLKILDLLREALSMQSIGITDEHVEKYIAQESSIQHWINGGGEGCIGRPWVSYVKGAKLLVRIDSRHTAALVQKLEEQEEQLTGMRAAIQEYKDRELAEPESRLSAISKIFWRR